MSRLDALDKVVRKFALETMGSDDPPSLYSASLNLLLRAQDGASPGFLRLDPAAVMVPRQRPEPL